MPATRIPCPNCRQPIVAEINQLFDQNVDPTAKQRLLSGSFNQISCPVCGYQGMAATPIVYHDPEKELLLTYVPAEIGLPRDEQERVIGAHINQVIAKLAPEKRKGYLFQPQQMFTMQGMLERILQADGITKEMIDAQQKRLTLIQRLVNATSPDAFAQIVQEEDALIDADFFGIFNRLLQVTAASGDQAGSKRLAEVQKQLLATTKFGQEIQSQSKEVEQALNDLRAAGDQLDREKLLQLVIDAPNEIRLNALVSLARPGFDYQFFQLLSDRIERARGDGRARLIKLRDEILDITRELDRQMAERLQASRQLLEEILKEENVEEAIEANLPAIDDFFVQEVNSALEAARARGDLERSAKIERVITVLKELSEASPDLSLVEELMSAPDDASRRIILDDNREEITPEFINTLTGIAAQIDTSEDKEMAEQFKSVYRQILRYSMEKNIGGAG